MEDYQATYSLKMLSDYLCRYYGKKVIILLTKGIPAEKIQKYGFAFEGKTVLIG